MRVNKLGGWSSSSFLSLLICLQCSDNDFGGGDVSRDALYELGGKIDLISVVKRDKNSIGGNECVVFWYHLP